MSFKVGTMGTLAQRFEAKHQKADGCWPWTGGCDAYGYGYIWNDGRLRKATHISLKLYRDIEVGEQQALHECDNPNCVNPHHLFVGTRSDNMRDCSRKGRARNQKVKDISAVRDLTPRQISERFGVRYTHACKLKRSIKNVEC